MRKKNPSKLIDWKHYVVFIFNRSFCKIVNFLLTFLGKSFQMECETKTKIDVVPMPRHCNFKKSYLRQVKRFFQSKLVVVVWNGYLPIA
jgi:hypothetical protein